jgi:hypothetical protein
MGSKGKELALSLSGHFVQSKNLAAHGGKPGGAWRVRGAIKKPAARARLRKHRENDYGVGA